MGIMEKVPVKFFTRNFFLSSSGYSQPPQGTYLIRLNLMENREEQQEWRKDERKKMKGKRVIAGILLVGILATALAGCKNADVTKKEREKPVITLGTDLRRNRS